MVVEVAPVLNTNTTRHLRTLNCSLLQSSKSDVVSENMYPYVLRSKLITASLDRRDLPEWHLDSNGLPRRSMEILDACGIVRNKEPGRSSGKTF